ncbi:MAG: hypothetical protein H6642_16530 [Caldilineaceae bacterium]|nr:hypothetical protein [Caldilineaceae bacterium]
MRFPYTVTAPTQNEFDSLPRLPLTLQMDRHRVEAVGLVDSGATVNVLPYDIGLQLGESWEDRKATIKLAGNLGGFAAQPVFAMATIGGLAPVRLVFAWTRSNDVSLILGQMNFFMEFEVCFFRKQREFEVKLAST